MKTIKTGSDFSGVGAFDQALERLNIKQDKQFACDMDKYARETYILNFGEPKYYPKDVYEREIPKESLDIYMTSPPCQAFSNAGKRLGEDDKRGILFYNSHEFIKVNKPRFFIFENVKGLLSDDKSNKKLKYGKTFTTWLQYLGGKSINGVPNLFPHEQAIDYHIYHKVLNAKHYGTPQNRERVFIVGIRDDQDNVFSWPKPIQLKKTLKDVLEKNVDDKYFLSEKMLESIEYNGNKVGIIADLNKGGQKGIVFSENSTYINCLTATDYKQPKQIQIGAIRGRNPKNPTSLKSGLPTKQMLEINENNTSNALTTVQKDNVLVIGNIKDIKHDHASRVYDKKGISPTITTKSGYEMTKILVNSANSKGYDECENGDSINLEFPNSKTRRGRVEKKVAQTLDTGCNQGVLLNYKIRRLTPLECFRLMDFNENFKWNVSDTQAYKQAGNSICVGVLSAIISKLKL